MVAGQIWRPSKPRRLAPVSGRRRSRPPGAAVMKCGGTTNAPSSARRGGACGSWRCPMARIWSTDLAAHTGQPVTLAGWLHHLRRLSRVSFLILRDGKGLAQIVVEEPALLERLAELPNETVLRIKGEAVAVPQAPGGVEVHNPTVEVLSVPSEPPPFEMHRPTLGVQLPTMLDNAAVSLRHPRQRAIARLADASVAGYRATLRANDFVEIFTPKIVASATEGGANVFPVEYFGRQAY